MYYRKLHGLICAPSRGWQKELYGYECWCKGDALSGSALMAVAHNDPEMLLLCLKLLKEGKRWPDELSHENDAKTWIGWQISRHLRKWGFREHEKYRPQTYVTRDPCLAVAYSLALAGKEDKIKEIKIPFLRRRPSSSSWLRYMKTGKGKKMYEWWALFQLRRKLPNYVIHHMAFCAYVAESDKVKNQIFHYGFIPPWNLLIDMLCDVALRYNHEKHQEKINKYKPKILYQWSGDYHFETYEWFDGRYYPDGWYLPEDEYYKPDKDILNYVIYN